MKQDLFNNLSPDVQLDPIAVTATTDITGTDLQGYESACFLIILGLWVDGTHTFTCQESSDNATWTTVAAGDLDGTAPTVSGVTNDNTSTKIGYRGSARYIRILNTVTASPSTGLVMGSMILRGHPNSGPV